MSDNQDALRLADDLIHAFSGQGLCAYAAAELRRLHAKCEALTADTLEEMDRITEIHRLRALNAELVGALRHCMKVMQDEADAYLAWNNDTNATLLAEIAALKEYLNDKR